MDPISGIASITAIAGFLQTLYKELKRYAKALGNATTDAKGLAREVSNFVGLLLLVESSLSSLPGMLQTSSRFVRVQKTQIASAKTLTYGLNQLIGDLPNLLERGQGNIFQRFLMRHRWTAIKNEVQTLRCSVETSKSSLNLLLGTVHLEQLKTALEELSRQKVADHLQHRKQVKSLEKRIATFKTQLRTERNRTARLQAQYRQNIKEQGKKLESSLDTTQAAQEAMELAKDELHSVSGSSTSRSCSSQFRRSTTPPREYDSDEYVGSEEGSQHIIEVQACSSPDTENESSISAIRPQASEQASSSQVNDLRLVPMQPSDPKVADGIAQDIDENGNWIFLGQDTDNKPSGKVWRGFGTRVRDEDGRITWREIRSPKSSASST